MRGGGESHVARGCERGVLDTFRILDLSRNFAQLHKYVSDIMFIPLKAVDKSPGATVWIQPVSSRCCRAEGQAGCSFTLCCRYRDHYCVVADRLSSGLHDAISLF